MAAAGLLSAAGAGSMKLLTSKTFWIVLGLIVLAIIIWRYSDRIITKGESRLGPQTGDWQEGTITEGRKKQLEDLAQTLYNDIYGSFNSSGDGSVPSMGKAAALNDNELLYLARYYENNLSQNGNSLWFDVDEEWLPFTSEDEGLMSRLADIGMK